CLMVKGDDRSDTRTFAEDYLAKLPPSWLDSDTLTDLVDDYIGQSKLVILTKSEECRKDWYIIGEKRGSWKDNVWYSNRSYTVAGKGSADPRKAGAKSGTGKSGTGKSPLGIDSWWDDWSDDGWKTITATVVEADRDESNYQ